MVYNPTPPVGLFCCKIHIYIIVKFSLLTSRRSLAQVCFGGIDEFGTPAAILFDKTELKNAQFHDAKQQMATNVIIIIIFFLDKYYSYAIALVTPIKAILISNY